MKGSKTMNEIKIITELCAEDRARIDRLTAAMERMADDMEPPVIALAGTPFETEPKVTEPEKVETPEPVIEETPVAEVGAPDDEPDVKEVPEHTKAELQQKVISLVTAGKKDEVKAIIEQYAERVSAIPDEKINEVWDKLTKLEG
jgi:hypothetical protein